MSPQILWVKEMFARFAASTSPVLIEGESGTGKKLAAVAIHRLSVRHRGPLADLPGLPPSGGPGASSGKLPTLAEVEQELIRRVLRLCRNDTEKTDLALGISRRTITRRMKEYRTC